MHLIDVFNPLPEPQDRIALHFPFLPDTEGDPDFEPLRQIFLKHNVKMVERPLGETIKLMDAAHISHVVMPAWKMRSVTTGRLVQDHTWQRVGEKIAQYPDRLRGWYSINPFDRMRGVREMKQVLTTQRGFVGAHFFATGFERPLNHRDWYPFYAACEEVGKPVGMFVGWLPEIQPTSTVHPELLDDVACYFNDLVIVATHYVGPWEDSLMALAHKHPNLYIATAGTPPRRWSEKFVHFIDTWGRGKVMWGTTINVNWEESIGDLNKLPLKDESRELLYHGVAEKVFKLK